MSQCVQRIQPAAITSLTSSTQDTSNTSLLSSSNTSSINQPAIQPILSKVMVSVASSKEKELAADSSPVKLSGVSPRTSTPYKRQSLPNVTSPLTSPPSTDQLVKPANKII